MRHCIINTVHKSTGILLSLFLVMACIHCQGQQQTPTPQWRPVYHFTPDSTWTNDPNGLFYLNGVYHLYYQNNPFANIWGHMSWGHAISKDLLHWQQLPVAIPEVVKADTTISIFSGSAVLDNHHTSGFAKNTQTPVVAVFTGDLPRQKKEAQYIAYSNDSGKTFRLYPGNPVIDIGRPDFRDPNVFWHASSHQWVMAVSLVHEHKIRFYGSGDLKHWSILSDFGPAGYTGHDWECPSLIPLAADKNNSETKWVLLVSCWGERGPYMQYFIGDFDGRTFHNDNPAARILTLDGGDCFYAAIPWRLEHNRQILIGWLVPGSVATSPWRGQMSIPRDLSLRNTDSGRRLFQRPSSILLKGLEKMSGRKKTVLRNLTLKDQVVRKIGDATSYWLEATFDIKKAAKLGVQITENSTGDKKVVIGYDAAKQVLFVDCSAIAGTYKTHENLFQSTPLKASNGKVKIQVFFDRSSLEIFGNDGQKVISTMLYPSKDESGISIFSDGTSVLRRFSLRRFD